MKHIFPNADLAMKAAAYELETFGGVVDVGKWHAQEVSDEFIELLMHSFHVRVASSKDEWAKDVKPNLPWADMHFDERVGGKPVNPPPSHKHWPFAKQDNSTHLHRGKFSHTYPERMWATKVYGFRQTQFEGIRFEPGDLGSVVSLLNRDRHTRQAYLPIWFPEDTGAVEGQRVPCTLGYHFIIRHDYLHMIYYIRSCDLIRHFRDDVYMAGRLMQWVASKLENPPNVGALTMHITSLHCFASERRNIPHLFDNYKGLFK